MQIQRPQFIAAIIQPARARIAVILVDIESTYPVPATAIVQQAWPIFPTLPIMVMSPRITGFSRTWAPFDLRGLIALINADEIDWQHYTVPDLYRDELPF